MNDMVTIPRAEYDRLVAAAEALSDLDAYAKAKARLANGDDELVPAAFANRLLDGESPVRVYRELRSLSGAELARRSGVNRVHLLNIEDGKSAGSIETMRRLADALGVQIDDLV